MLAVAALVLAGGCVGPFPRRVPGSDITLPPPTGNWLLESLIDCATGVKVGSKAGDKDLSTPRDGAKCRTATGDTVPDARGPTPPPAKTP
jgi:hypothetical protein